MLLAFILKSCDISITTATNYRTVVDTKIKGLFKM